MAIATFNDHGIRFNHPADWEVEVDRDGEKTTVTINAPDGVAFALLALDEDGPEPGDVAAQALEAMRGEYPDLEAVAVVEVVGGFDAVGSDVEFLSLDATNACAIRCFRTPRRTVLVFGQWSDLEGGEPAEQIRDIRGTLEETDS